MFCSSDIELPVALYTDPSLTVSLPVEILSLPVNFGSSFRTQSSIPAIFLIPFSSKKQAGAGPMGLMPSACPVTAFATVS